MYIQYRPNGLIVSCFVGPSFMWDAQVKDVLLNTIEIEWHDVGCIDTHFIKESTLTTRPTQSTSLSKAILTSDGVDTITITDAPAGIFTATNTTTRETVTGSISGSDTFSTTVAGTYEIKIESFPYLDFVTTVEAI